MKAKLPKRSAVIVVAALALVIGAIAAPSALAGGAPTPPVRPGVAMSEPIAAPLAPTFPTAPFKASYTHTPPQSSGNDLSPGSGQVMTSTNIHYIFWLPTGQHFEANAAGDTNYENLLIQWANDLGSTQSHNLVTQYGGTNGTTGNTVTFGGSTTDTTAYPHAGTTADPLQDADIQAAVHRAVVANGWTENVNNIYAVFTANNIQECASSGAHTTASAPTTTTSPTAATMRSTRSWHSTTSPTRPGRPASPGRPAATPTRTAGTIRTAT
jgi:hypothetical protein